MLGREATRPACLTSLLSVLYKATKHSGFPCWAGQLPALDSGLDIVSTTGSDEYDAAHAIIQHLKSSGADLDQALEPSQQALCMAFSALIQLKLQPATLYATWCEPNSFTQHTRVRQCLPKLATASVSVQALSANIMAGCRMDGVCVKASIRPADICVAHHYHPLLSTWFLSMRH